MPLDITKFNKQSATLQDLATALFNSFNDLESQVNQQPTLAVNADGTFPAGLGAASSFLATIAKGGKMSLSIPLGKGTKRDLNITDLGGPYQAPLPLNFLGQTTSTSPPSVTEFPNEGDWGFHFNSTSPGFYYLAYNVDGATIEYVNLNTDGIFHTTNFVGRTTSTNPPSITEYPNNRDWGFHVDSSPSPYDLYLAYNNGGTVENVPFNFDPFGNTQFLGRLSGSVPPTTANFPNPRDWGFFENTSTSALNLCFNDGGTLKKVTLT